MSYIQMAVFLVVIACGSAIVCMTGYVLHVSSATASYANCREVTVQTSQGVAHTTVCLRNGKWWLQ